MRNVAMSGLHDPVFRFLDFSIFVIHELRFCAHKLSDAHRIVTNLEIPLASLRLCFRRSLATCMAWLTPCAIPLLFAWSLSFFEFQNCRSSKKKSIFWHCRASAFLWPNVVVLSSENSSTVLTIHLATCMKAWTLRVFSTISRVPQMSLRWSMSQYCGLSETVPWP